MPTRQERRRLARAEAGAASLAQRKADAERVAAKRIEAIRAWLGTIGGSTGSTI